MHDKFIKRILKRLENIESRLAKAEGHGVGVGDNTAKVGKSRRAVKLTKSLPARIISLRDNGFFKQPLIPEEVHKKLISVYRCEKNRVEVALLRLQTAKQLRKSSKVINGKRITAYVW